MPWAIALPLSTGAMAGLAFGRSFATGYPTRRLQQAFAVMDMAVAALLTARGLNVGMPGLQ